MEAEMACAFCEDTKELILLKDQQETFFFCCPWCWTHVLAGGLILYDVKATQQEVRSWLLGRKPEG